MKPRLIILSDLWGLENADWLPHYLKLLGNQFEVVVYDCCVLGMVDKSDYTETILHSQFVKTGIDVAVKQLLTIETGLITILGFSIGGLIGWKAAKLGLSVKHLYAISSTRLRYEEDKPDCPIKLIFGELDSNKPSLDWFHKLDLTAQFIQGKNHLLYTELLFAENLCRLMHSQKIKEKQ